MSFEVPYDAWNTLSNDYALADGGNHSISVRANGSVITGLTPVEDGAGRYHVTLTDTQLPEGASYSLYGTSSTSDVRIVGATGVRPYTPNNPAILVQGTIDTFDGLNEKFTITGFTNSNVNVFSGSTVIFTSSSTGDKETGTIFSYDETTYTFSLSEGTTVNYTAGDEVVILATTTPDTYRSIRENSGASGIKNNYVQQVVVGSTEEEVLVYVGRTGNEVGPTSVDFAVYRWSPGDSGIGNAEGYISKELGNGWYVFSPGASDIAYGDNLILVDNLPYALPSVVVWGIDPETPTKTLERPIPHE